MSDLTIYRVRQSATHPKRWVRRAWYGRTWQAEWDGCLWAARAYTEAGVRRKAAQRMTWSQRRNERYYARCVWIRTWILRREGYQRLWPWQVKR